MNHQTRTNLARKTGVTVAAGSDASMMRECKALRNLQHVVHFREDAGTVGSE